MGGEKKVEEQLKDLGTMLQTPPSNKDSLLILLKQASVCLAEIDQSQPASFLDKIQPFLDSIVKAELLRNQDTDVKLLVAACLCEITRVTAPSLPYPDDLLKEIFDLIVGTFSGLSDAATPSFGKRVIKLETLSKYRSCGVMLDRECHDLVKKMFTTFFAIASDDHQESILLSMQNIMVAVVEESEDVRDDLLLVILFALGRNRNDISAAARKLAMNVIEHCAMKLESGINQFLISSASRENKSENDQVDYHEVIYDIYRCAPQMLSGVIPYLTGELLTDDLVTRTKAVGLVGDLFALPGSAIHEMLQPVFSEFLKRLTDRVISLRMSILEHVKRCLLANPFRAEAPQILAALCDRLLDYDENVRKQVVDVICNVTCHALSSIPVETIKLVAERLRDKSLLVKRYTMERLAEIFRVYCGKSRDSPVSSGTFDWIPGKIFRCFFDKDFRSDTIESVLCWSLFPPDYSVKDQARHWVKFFSLFDKVEVKAFEKIMEQKQRIQQEMQRCLSLRQIQEAGDAAEVHKKVQLCFRIMSRLFAEPAKAEENFLIYDQLKDTNIWKIVTTILDPNTGFHQACAARDDLLKILGEKHRLHDFISMLSTKCSFVLLNKEHVKEIMLEVTRHKSDGNLKFAESCMDILRILARFCPSFFCGAEEELVNFLKDDNAILKEGVLHILALAGGTIREHLPVSSSSMDLLLERLCLEGSRRQAKYAVHALAAITKDDGLKSLSVLYKRLVDMLDDNRNLPAILQSLGCIAQTAIPVFETRETEVADFIQHKILECDSKMEDHEKSSWGDRSELCLQKIYGIKTLVRIYLPAKDAQLRPGIGDLLQILRSLLMYGEVSNDIKSSLVDKAHMKLASARSILRLSRQWDHEISADLFHLTLKTAETEFPEARKIFLAKVHQYIKDRLLEPKYACAFLFDAYGSKLLHSEEEKQNLADIIQMHNQAKGHQLCAQSDINPQIVYPEYILAYLVHALAHQSCPDVDSCKDVKAFELIYRKLHFVLTLLLPKDNDVKLEVGNKKEDIVLTILSILKSIKNSEDLVEATKIKNSHAISDLGFSIIKRLVPKVDDFQNAASLIPLPQMLYKRCGNRDEENSLANKEKTWLADESVLTHFASLELETDGLDGSVGVVQDVPEVNETDGNEVPLGEMIKRLKSQGAKSGKIKKNKPSSVEVENAGENVDILKMVREINLDNLAAPDKFESSNGHKHSPTVGSKSNIKHQHSRKRETSDMTSAHVPKRRRSVSAHGALSEDPSKIHPRVPGDNSSADWKERKGSQISRSTNSDLLVLSPPNKRSTMLKNKGKSSNVLNNGKHHKVGAENDDNLIENSETTRTIKSSSGSLKKQKRQGISRMKKCTMMEDSGIDNEELIGCRIKVWWPMDKAFYEGTIKSYDSLKGKHVILYEDGDVEVLRLEKESWQLVDSGRKSRKKLKLSKRPTLSEALAAHKHGSDGLHKKGQSDRMVSKERTRKLKKKEMRAKKDSDVSDPEPNVPSEVPDTEQGGSPENSSERVTENGSDLGKSDKEIISASREDDMDDSEESPIQGKESDVEVESDSKGKTSEVSESPSQGAADCVREVKSDSDEEEIDKPDESQEDESQEDESRKSDNGDQEPVEYSCKKWSKLNLQVAEPSETGDAEFSDDEPLSNWKQKVGKSASRRTI